MKQYVEDIPEYVKIIDTNFTLTKNENNHVIMKSMINFADSLFSS